MISKLSLLLLSLVVTAVAHAEPLAPSEVKALLDQIRAKRASAPQVQADFQEEKTVHLMNKPIRSAGKVWFQNPNKFRREVQGNSPSITVSDGQQLWIYYPNSNRPSTTVANTRPRRRDRGTDRGAQPRKSRTATTSRRASRIPATNCNSLRAIPHSNAF
jgi:outer membrane lipoprotein-sorting protein